MADASKKPLIPTGIHTEFGELLDDPEFTQRLDADITYTPGWSEARVARDTAIAEVVAGKRQAKDVPTLKGNVRLVRRTRTSGSPDEIKAIMAGQRGYKPLTKADIGPDKLVTAMPPSSVVLADGTIAKGDCVYMFCDAQRAARNSYEKQKATQARLSAAQERAQSAGVDYSSALGPTLEGVPTSRVQVK